MQYAIVDLLDDTFTMQRIYLLAICPAQCAAVVTRGELWNN